MYIKMPWKYYKKRLIIEVTDNFHQMVREQAKALNMTIRAYLYRLIHNQVVEREKLRKKN